MTLVDHEPTIAGWDEPPGLLARGTVILIAGRGEHPGVYERFGRRLAADAYRVRAVGDPTVDAESVVEQLRRLLDNELPRPLVLAGSDGGALFAAALVADGEFQVDALLLAGLPSKQAPTTSDDWELELNERTACPTHQARLDADERVTRGAIGSALPPDWFDRADLSAVEVPILGVHGRADGISPIELVRPRFESARRAQLVTILGGKHDALNDASHRTAAASVVLFLERLRLGADLPEIAHIELS